MDFDDCRVVLFRAFRWGKFPWFLLSCVHDCARDYTIRALTKIVSPNLCVVGIGYLYMVLEFWLGAGQHTREVTVPT